jgi:short-subunit dehydrogenase
MPFSTEHIWIIGASSGIGASLSKELASQGATLILSARNKNELETLNQTLGGTHHVYPLDIASNDEVKKAANAISKKVKTIDRIILLAAIYKPADIEKMDMGFAKQLVEVNLLGAMYLTNAIMPIFTKQRAGQIVLCGSVAGYTGLPGGQPYSATKAAIINFAESLHAEAEDYIDVKLISPGFVRTPMTDKNPFPMPMRIEPEQAAKAIARGLQKRGFEIHFPKRFTLLVKFLRLFPYSLALFITRNMRSKS